MTTEQDIEERLAALPHPEVVRWVTKQIEPTFDPQIAWTQSVASIAHAVAAECRCHGIEDLALETLQRMGVSAT